MHATLWVDDRRQAWITLYADGTRTWRPALGSLRLADHHEIPESMPTAARVEVEGEVVPGAQPRVTYDGLEFHTTGRLSHPADEPAYGVGPSISLSGRYRVRPGGVLSTPRIFLGLFVINIATQYLVPLLTWTQRIAIGVAGLAVFVAVVLVRRRRARHLHSAAFNSGVVTRLRAVSWLAAPAPRDQTLPVLVSLYAPDAAAGAQPVGTLCFKEALDPPIGYADEVVVRGALRPGSVVAIEHAGRNLPLTQLRTDLAPVRPYRADVGDRV